MLLSSRPYERTPVPSRNHMRLHPLFISLHCLIFDLVFSLRMSLAWPLFGQPEGRG
jgi:hypothetical protein